MTQFDCFMASLSAAQNSDSNESMEQWNNKNSMKKIIILTIIIILLLGSASVVIYSSWQKDKESKFLSSNPQTMDAYALIQKRETQLKKNKYNYDALMSMAFQWKGIGEATKNNEYLLRAVKFYDKIIKHWGNKAYLPFLNRANIYIELKDYVRAEQDLKIASEIDRGEQGLYIALANLYKDYMKKSNEEIKTVYTTGMQAVVGGANLVNNYASFLNDTGDYKESLKYYKMLKQAFPNYVIYDEVIKELETKLPKT